MGTNNKKISRQPKVKEPIRLRFKRLSNGSQSIYFDIYADGKRSYEFLKLYIVPESSPIDKEHNRKMLEMAKTIQAQRIVELQTSEHGLSNKGNRKQRMLLCDFIRHIADKKHEQGGNAKRGTHLNYQALLCHVETFAPKTTFKQANKQFCTEFVEYLNIAKGKFTGQELHQNTQLGYIRMLGYIFNQAIKAEIISENPLKFFDKQELPKKIKQEIPFLTLDEVKRLNDTPCAFPEVKAAYLFSCYSGLRFSDIKALNWGSIRQGNNGETMLVYRQKKTDKQEYLPLATPALDILQSRERSADTDLVFTLQDNKEVNMKLKSFAAAAGIDDKKVTFHTARHTCATLLLSLGVGIETVSKVLGHSEIRTTQIYAKVLAEQVKIGVHKLDNIFD